MNAWDEDFASELRAEAWAERRRLRPHFCMTCLGFTGPGSPCAPEEPEEDESAQDEEESE